VWCVARQRRLEDERRRQRDKWGIATCDNQMAKKRLRQSREAESAAARQQGRRNNHLANKRQTKGEGTSVKWEGRHQRTRGGGAPRGRETAAAQREALRQPAGGGSRASSSSSASFPPAGMAAPLARSLAMGVAATSPASSTSSASVKSAHPPLSSSTPFHHHRHPLRLATEGAGNNQ